MAHLGDTGALYASWFALADGDRDGRLTGGEAVAFLSRADLPKHTLKRVRCAALCVRDAGGVTRDAGAGVVCAEGAEA